jgi:hydrogenase/urease accessory protein HupE
VRRSAGLALCLLVGFPSLASAHSPIAGVGHFYGGMLHPAVVPAHLMAIVAMGLWLGQRWPAGGSALVALLAAVPIGMVAGRWVGWQKGELVILSLTALIAVLVAAARDAPRVPRLAIATALGLFLGMDSMPDGLSGRPLWLSLAGTWFAVLLGHSWMIAMSEIAARPWMKIGVRVVASWLCAAAVLVLALSAFGPRAAGGSAPVAASAASSPP